MVVELVVALFIIGIGLIALAETMLGSFAGIQEGYQRSSAVYLADQRLEELKGAEWTTLADCLGDIICRGPDGTLEPYTAFTRTSEVVDVSDGLREVTVRVTYLPAGGASGVVYPLTILMARR